MTYVSKRTLWQLCGEGPGVTEGDMERLAHPRARGLDQVGDQRGGGNQDARLTAMDQMGGQERGQRVLPVFQHKPLDGGRKDSRVPLGTGKGTSK